MNENLDSKDKQPSRRWPLIFAGKGLVTFITSMVCLGVLTGGCTKNIENFETVQIGDQVWMAKNLDIKVADSYCYDNDPANCEKYGRLYTWEAAKEAADLVPGWHLPTDEEWTVLTDFLGENAGTKLMEGGSSGFNALLAGYANSGGDFVYLGGDGGLWSASPGGSSSAWSRSVSRGDAGVRRNDSGSGSRYYRFSVRLLRD